jgi:hypothetical protein
MRMLCEWADRIVIMQAHMVESVPEDLRLKTLSVDVGVDRFGIYIHPELLQMVQRGAEWLENRVPS